MNWFLDKIVPGFMIGKNTSQFKTRDLPLYEFFVKLQEEYVIAELRRKIYSKAKDKIYYEKVMKFKKEKIDDIVLRNCLPSIFTSESTKQRYYSKIYNKSGLPNFIYKDDTERQVQYVLDVQNYYSVNSDVKVDIGEDVEVGSISELNIDKQVVFVKINNKILDFEFSKVTRIL